MHHFEIHTNTVTAAEMITPMSGMHHDFVVKEQFVQINPDNGNMSLTGLNHIASDYVKSKDNWAALSITFRNCHGTNTVTLKHQDTGSAVGNRFNIAGGSDKVLNPGECATVHLLKNAVTGDWEYTTMP